jgi:hypothetical protein
MHAKTLPIAAAIGLFIGSISVVHSQQGGAPGQRMQGGSAGGGPGASGAAPGREMQERGSRPGEPGASGFAPGREGAAGDRDRDDRVAGTAMTGGDLAVPAVCLSKWRAARTCAPLFGKNSFTSQSIVKSERCSQLRLVNAPMGGTLVPGGGTLREAERRQEDRQRSLPSLSPTIPRDG